MTGKKKWGIGEKKKKKKKDVLLEQ